MKKWRPGILLPILTIIICLSVSVAALTGEQPDEASDTVTGLTFAEMFPDDNFRAYVTETVLKDSTDAKGDHDKPTAAQMSIIESRTSLYLFSRSISSLKGISYFTALTDLECGANQLTELDVSQNAALKYLYCYNNQLTELDVSQNATLNCLSCYSNQLTELDVSRNAALENLRCYSNQLTELDVSQNAALYCLYCYSNQLTELDVSQNSALEELCCYSNQLTELDVSKNIALTSLLCGSNQLTELDLSKNTELKKSATSVSTQSIRYTDVVIAFADEAYTLNLLELAPGLDLSRVTMNDGGRLDAPTGIVTYTEKPETVSYLYQTNSPNSDEMIVNWTPVFAGSSVLAGDLDGDGSLSLADVVMLAKYLLGAATLTDEQIAAADLNGDGAATATDLVLLAKKLL